MLSAEGMDEMMQDPQLAASLAALLARETVAAPARGQRQRATTKEAVRSTNHTRTSGNLREDFGWNAIRPVNSSTICSSLMVSRNGSDLFITAEFPPAIKVDGKVTKVSPQPLTRTTPSHWRAPS